MPGGDGERIFRPALSPLLGCPVNLPGKETIWGLEVTTVLHDQKSTRVTLELVIKGAQKCMR